VEAQTLLKPGVSGPGPTIEVIGKPQEQGEGALQLHLARLAVRTTQGPQFVDLTEEVQGILSRTGVREGIALVYSRHTTAGVVINENEPLLIGDMCAFLGRLAPPDGEYAHNDFSVRTVNMCEDECANGHAHCQHLTVGCQATLPVTGGELALGTWQRIFLLEMDRPRLREVVVQVLGR
jgi:secondary thiamine-phosphate synthase enzyme